MKHLYIFFILLSSLRINAQELDFENHFGTLITHLENEEWTQSEKISKELLNLTSKNPDFSHEEMVLRYMYIFSVSGLMNEGLLTKDQALQNIKFLEGKDMILASHPFHLNCTLNCTQISEDRKDTFRTCVTNNDGTQIFSFEYIEIKDGIKETVDQLEGKIIHIKANLSEVSVEGTILPRFRLNFSNGEYML